MSVGKKINLQHKSERLLGRFMPTFHYKSILVGLHDDADGINFGHTKVTIKGSISFTKPQGLTDHEAVNFIEKNLDDLYLYTWISPFENLNSNLANNNFKVFDLYEKMWTLSNPSIDTFTTSHYFYSDFLAKAWEIYTGGENPHGTSFISEGTNLWSSDFYADSPFGSDMSNALQFVGLFNRDANLAAFGWWVTINKFNSGEDTTPDGLASMAGLIDINSPISMATYLLFGDDYLGPWNKADTISADTMQGLMMNYYMSHFTPADLTAASEAGISASEYFIQTHMLPIAEDLGGLAATGVVTSLRDYLKSSGVGLGVLADGVYSGIDPASLRTNSYVYDYFDTIIDDMDVYRVPDTVYDYGEEYIKRSKISLKALLPSLSESLTGVSDYGSKMVFNKTFDADNNEIFKIDNIKLEFVYGSAEGFMPAAMDPTTAILQEPSVFAITTVGLDTANIESKLEESNYVTPLKTTHRTALNHYFGNITYEEILKNGDVPTQYYEYYVYSDDQTPFDGIPIQGLNGKIYADNNISRKSIIQNYGKLIAAYADKEGSDSDLKTNLNNLRVILTRDATKPNLTEIIKRFQRTFPNKNPATPSGRFYLDFKTMMLDINSRIMSDRTVERRIALNTIVLDVRPHRPVGNDYYAVFPNTEEFLDEAGTKTLSGEPEDYYFLGNVTTSGDYISNKASKIFRNLEYIPVEGGDTATSTSELSKLREVVYEALSAYAHSLDSTDGSGDTMLTFPAEILEAAAEEILEDEAEKILEYSGVDVSKVNMIVKNSGYWYFDLEKAMHTQSSLANLIDLKKMNVFLNLTIPYKYFPVAMVTMTRNDLKIPADYSVSGESDPHFGEVVQTILTSNFNTQKDYPALLSTHWGQRHNFESDYSYVHEKYGRPVVDLVDALGTDLGKKDYSCVKYVFFDVAKNCNQNLLGFTRVGDSFVDSPIDNRSPYSPHAPTRFSPSLRDFGSAKGYPTLTPGRDGLNSPMILTNGIGQPSIDRISKSYRLLGFEFTDYMDDDVAIINTPGTYVGMPESAYSSPWMMGEDWEDLLREVNPDNEPNAWYDITVTVEDKSLEYINAFYTDVIQPLYNAFIEYVDYAEELCSYNESAGEFNEFFVDAMVEKYITDPKKTILNSYTEMYGVMANILALDRAPKYASGDEPLFGVEEFDLGKVMSKTAAEELEKHTTVTLSDFDFNSFAKSFAPWVTGALLLSFIKEIFFNKTPNRDLFQVFYSLTNTFGSYDPELDGPIDPEVTSFIREMYSLTPQKGNLEALLNFKERLQPLIQIFEFKHPDMIERIEELTGIEADDPDFHSKAMGPEGHIHRNFYGRLQIQQPLAPGISRFYIGDASDSYLFADSGIFDDVGDITHLSAGEAMGPEYGMTPLLVEDIIRVSYQYATVGLRDTGHSDVSDTASDYVASGEYASAGIKEAAADLSGKGISTFGVRWKNRMSEIKNLDYWITTHAHLMERSVDAIPSARPGAGDWMNLRILNYLYTLPDWPRFQERVRTAKSLGVTEHIDPVTHLSSRRLYFPEEFIDPEIQEVALTALDAGELSKEAFNKLRLTFWINRDFHHPSGNIFPISGRFEWYDHRFGGTHRTSDKTDIAFPEAVDDASDTE